MYIVGMIHNVDANRWHPILFRLSPSPSGELNSGAQRYRSAGHHTSGFDSREVAVEEAKLLATKTDNAALMLEKDFVWDDNEILPVMTIWATIQNGQAKFIF